MARQELRYNCRLGKRAIGVISYTNPKAKIQWIFPIKLPGQEFQ